MTQFDVLPINPWYFPLTRRAGLRPGLQGAPLVRFPGRPVGSGRTGRDGAPAGFSLCHVPVPDSCTAAKQHLYSITSSARRWRAGGIVNHSAVAALSFIT